MNLTVSQLIFPLFLSDVTLNITDPQIDCRLSQLIIICVSVTVVVFVILGKWAIIDKTLEQTLYQIYKCLSEPGHFSNEHNHTKVKGLRNIYQTSPHILCNCEFDGDVTQWSVAGAVFTVLCLKRKSRRIQKNNVSLHIYENTDTLRAAQVNKPLLSSIKLILWPLMFKN